MARQRDFAAAAQRRAVDRGDHRLVARFQLVERFAQVGADRRLAEFGDVGAREKRPPVAADHHRLDAVVAQRLLDPGDQPLPHRRAERVDRRVVGDNDEHVVVLFSGNDGHGRGSFHA